jgi:hypothetical protein
MPALDAARAAAARAREGATTTRTEFWAGSIFGVSPQVARAADAAGGRSMPYRATISWTSASVLGSATVGPEAMAAGSSPGMSLIAKVTTRAGRAASARRPPLMRERCLRTAFISTMLAPLASRLRLTACLSARVISPAGSTSREEPPPDISAMTRSSAVSPRTAARIRRPASSLMASGVGWEASSTSMRPAGAPCP